MLRRGSRARLSGISRRSRAYSSPGSISDPDPILPTTLLVDTYTGADNTNLGGTTSDSGLTRQTLSGTPKIIGNEATSLAGFAGVKYLLSATPTRIQFDYYSGGDGGLTIRSHVFYDGGSNYYFVKTGSGNITIQKSGVGLVPWTTGSATGGFGNDGTLTIDITTDTLTVIVDEPGMGEPRVLTYTEASMPGQANLYFGVDTNGGTWDNVRIYNDAAPQITYDAHQPSYVMDDGTAVYNGGNTSWIENGMIRLKATTDRIGVLCYTDATFSLYEDGVYKRTLTQSVAASFQWLYFIPTDWLTEHEYWLVRDKTSGGLGLTTNYARSVQIKNARTLPAKAVWQWFGGSSTNGFGVSGRYSQNAATQVSIARGVNFVNSGVNGETTVTAAPLLAGRSIYGATKAIVMYGANDVLTGTSTNNFKNAVYDCIIALLGAGFTRIEWVGMIDLVEYPAQRLDKNALAAAIIAGGADARGNTLTAGEQAKISYYNTDGVVTNYSDTVHPNNAGYAQLAAFLLANLPA